MLAYNQTVFNPEGYEFRITIAAAQIIIDQMRDGEFLCNFDHYLWPNPDTRKSHIESVIEFYSKTEYSKLKNN